MKRRLYYANTQDGWTIYNPMEWKSYPIYPDYEVSDEGQVRRVKDGKMLKQYPQKSGYVAVFINTGRGNKPMPVHTMVAETFLTRLPYQDRVDHINTIRSDNRVANLRWADAKENANNETTKINMSKARRKILDALTLIKPYKDYEDDETELLYPPHYKRKINGNRRCLAHSSKGATETGRWKKRKRK